MYHGKQKGEKVEVREAPGESSLFYTSWRVMAATQEHRGGFYLLQGPSCCGFALCPHRELEATPRGETEACQCTKGHLQPSLS